MDICSNCQDQVDSTKKKKRKEYIDSEKYILASTYKCSDPILEWMCQNWEISLVEDETYWKELFMGIIRQAIKDEAPKSFFTSDYFQFLWPGVDGAEIWEQVHYNWEQQRRGDKHYMSGFHRSEDYAKYMAARMVTDTF